MGAFEEKEVKNLLQMNLNDPQIDHQGIYSIGQKKSAKERKIPLLSLNV